VCVFEGMEGMSPCRPDCCQDGWGRLGSGLGLWVGYLGRADEIEYRGGYG
jgi:hypothetical protein